MCLYCKHRNDNHLLMKEMKHIEQPSSVDKAGEAISGFLVLIHAHDYIWDSPHEFEVRHQATELLWFKIIEKQRKQEKTKQR